MKQLKERLKILLYMFPRIFLFGIFLLCFLITVLISFDFLNPSGDLPGIDGAKTLNGVDNRTVGERADKPE
jgi:hypothetical protein